MECAHSGPEAMHADLGRRTQLVCETLIFLLAACLDSRFTASALARVRRIELVALASCVSVRRAQYCSHRHQGTVANMSRSSPCMNA
jgi:hypothetical protein